MSEEPLAFRRVGQSGPKVSIRHRSPAGSGGWDTWRQGRDHCVSSPDSHPPPGSGDQGSLGVEPRIPEAADQRRNQRRKETQDRPEPPTLFSPTDFTSKSLSHRRLTLTSLESLEVQGCAENPRPGAHTVPPGQLLPVSV